MTEELLPRQTQEERPRLQPDIVLCSLDHEIVAFSETAQCLVHLQPTAALVVRKLRDHVSFAELTQWLVAEELIEPGDSEQWLAETLAALASHGLLANGPSPRLDPVAISYEDVVALRSAAQCLPYVSVEPVHQRSYGLLGSRALIRFSHKAQIRLVDSVIGHLAQDTPADPTTVIEISATPWENRQLRSDVYQDGVPVAHAPRLSMLGPIVKAALWQTAINAHNFLFYIHAGVVSTGGTCVLLPAAAGSGKSSLTVALVHRGFRYFSDEVALIETGTFLVPPMPLAMCVKDTGWDLMERYYPAIASLPTHRRGDGKVVHYIPPPAGSADQSAQPVSHIIFPRYVAGVPTRLVPLGRCEALGRLMGECQAQRQRLDRQNVSDLIQWIAGVACYDLTFSSLETAVDLVVEVTGAGADGLGGSLTST